MPQPGRSPFQAGGKTVGVNDSTRYAKHLLPSHQDCVQPRNDSAVLVGSVFLAIFGNAVYDIFKNVFGTNTPALIRIAAIALFILVTAVLVVAWVIAQRLSLLPINIPFEVQQKALDRQFKGLILLVSNLEACRTAIQFHQPTLERCWLVCSPETLKQAQYFRSQFRECVDQPIVINDIYDPLKFRNCVHAIYRTRLPKGWQESAVIADYTGMTAHASVGTVLACLGTGRSLQYTPAKIDSQGKIVGSMNPIRILLHREVSKPEGIH
jgi:hypothetical protein